jgi:hypothetical protein
MPFAFQIRPISIEQGFYLSCEGIMRDQVRHPRLIDAIVHAAQLGRDLDGEIQIFDAQGFLAESLPLPSSALPGAVSKNQPIACR